jgi:sugar-specific transcriptional regulator TrmB
LEFQAAEVQALMDLGLDSSQAKIYFTLAGFGPLSVVEAAKRLNVNSSSAYCTLLRLYDLGLVEKINKSQIKFKAVSADQTLKFLLQRKTEPKPKPSCNAKAKTLDSNSGIKLISRMEQVIEQAIKGMSGAQESIDLIISWDFFSEFVYDSFPEKINPDVPKRCILEQPPNRKSLALINKFQNDSYILRFSQNKPKAMLAIFDKKEAIAIENLPEGIESPALITTNLNMLVLVKSYFENLWGESINPKPKITI